MPVVLARIRVPFLVVGLLLVAGSPLHDQAVASWLGAGLMSFSVASTFMPLGYVKREPIVVRSPVRGRWIAVNSPADRVPSHGVHSAGQAYAIDLVHWPDTDRPWRAVHGWPLLRHPREYPGFGQPILSPANGTVVRTRGWWRDHWSRDSWPALLYVFIEGALRELLGPGGLLGNHVVLDLGDGTYAVLAHLKRDSINVRKGDAVRAGQPLAQCGNSGNSSEPHIHFQLMDLPRTAFAAGLPFTFEGHGVPKNRQPFMASP